jgi:hypothetical protein
MKVLIQNVFLKVEQQDSDHFEKHISCSKNDSHS